MNSKTRPSSLPSYVDAETLSEKLRSRSGLVFSAERLVELAETGYLPCAYVDGDGPYFRVGVASAWINDHLIEHRDAIPFPKRINVIAESPCRTGSGLPKEIATLADHLQEMPLDHFFRETCMYFLVKAGKVVYVGQTTSLAGRIASHTLGKEFDRVLYMFVPASDISRFELELIRTLRPPLNGTGNPDRRKGKNASEVTGPDEATAADTAPIHQQDGDGRHPAMHAAGDQRMGFGGHLPACGAGTRQGPSEPVDA